MHAYLGHANIMVSAIQSCMGFNADAMEVMMDRPALVRNMQFQLMYSALFREIRVYTRAVIIPVSVSCAFDKQMCTHVWMRFSMHVHIFIYTITYLLSVTVDISTFVRLILKLFHMMCINNRHVLHVLYCMCSNN